MQIVKKINNNVALAKDGDGQDIVVFGRGIGFPAMPYELTDLSKIQRTFYDIKASYVGLATSIPEDIILLASDIVELARVELGCNLNPNLPFTLADHLNFAMERLARGLVLSTPLAYDVEHFYPAEVEIGRKALEIIKEQMGIDLPAEEATNVALHLVNGEMENSDMHSTLLTAKIVSDITKIMEDTLDIRLDTSSFNYSRFVLHIRYLIQRLEQDTQENSGMSATLRQMSREYPMAYTCTKKVGEYFFNTWNWQCNEDEMLYLFVHINRVKEHNDLKKEGDDS